MAGNRNSYTSWRFPLKMTRRNAHDLQNIVQKYFEQLKCQILFSFIFVWFLRKHYGRMANGGTDSIFFLRRMRFSHNYQALVPSTCSSVKSDTLLTALSSTCTHPDQKAQTLTIDNELSSYKIWLEYLTEMDPYFLFLHKCLHNESYHNLPEIYVNY